MNLRLPGRSCGSPGLLVSHLLQKRGHLLHVQHFFLPQGLCTCFSSAGNAPPSRGALAGSFFLMVPGSS